MLGHGQILLSVTVAVEEAAKLLFFMLVLLLHCPHFSSPSQALVEKRTPLICSHPLSCGPVLVAGKLPLAQLQKITDFTFILMSPQMPQVIGTIASHEVGTSGHQCMREIKASFCPEWKNK